MHKNRESYSEPILGVKESSSQYHKGVSGKIDFSSSKQGKCNTNVNNGVLGAILCGAAKVNFTGFLGDPKRVQMAIRRSQVCVCFKGVFRRYQ